MPRLTKAQIVARPDLAEELVPVPEWGGDVLVRELDGRARARFADAARAVAEKAPKGADGKPDRARQDTVALYEIMLGLVVASCPAEDGAPMFAVDELAKRAPAIVERLSMVALRLSKLSDEDVKTEAAALALAQSAGSTAV